MDYVPLARLCFCNRSLKFCEAPQTPPASLPDGTQSGGDKTGDRSRAWGEQGAVKMTGMRVTEETEG